MIFWAATAPKAVDQQEQTCENPSPPTNPPTRRQPARTPKHGKRPAPAHRGEAEQAIRPKHPACGLKLSQPASPVTGADP
jgi:hypothetical protein